MIDSLDENDIDKEEYIIFKMEIPRLRVQPYSTNSRKWSHAQYARKGRLTQLYRAACTRFAANV